MVAIKAKATRLYKRDRETYDAAHAAWRAGLVSHFYYGKRAPNDATIIWSLDGIEYAKDEGALVALEIDQRREQAGIESIELGTPTIGYVPITVRYVDGRHWTERYDVSRQRVVAEAFANGHARVVTEREPKVWGRVKVPYVDKTHPKSAGLTTQVWQLVPLSAKQAKAAKSEAKPAVQIVDAKNFDPTKTQQTPKRKPKATPVVDEVAAKRRATNHANAVASQERANARPARGAVERRDRLDEIHAIYQTGASIAKVAAQVGIPRSTVRRTLRLAGLLERSTR